MTTQRVRFCILLLTGAMPSLACRPMGEPAPEALRIPAIQDFLIDGGFGQRNPSAPRELEQFGRLVGIWEARQELRADDGTWATAAPALWIWRWGLDGFVIRDLWYQSEATLPEYLGELNRDYLLTGLRTYDVRAGRWRIAWTANGMGQTPGNDFGTMEAEWMDDRMVMRSPPDDYGLQRITFSDITDTSFVWLSEFSADDGASWQQVMRVKADRLR